MFQSGWLMTFWSWLLRPVPYWMMARFGRVNLLSLVRHEEVPPEGRLLPPPLQSPQPYTPHSPPRSSAVTAGLKYGLPCHRHKAFHLHLIKGKNSPWRRNLRRTHYRCSTLQCDTRESEVQREAPFNLHGADINDFRRPKWLAGKVNTYNFSSGGGKWGAY